MTDVAYGFLAQFLNNRLVRIYLVNAILVGRLGPVMFLCWIFLDQCPSSIFFCRGLLVFSWPIKFELTFVSRNTTSIEFAPKILLDLDAKLYG